MRVPQPLVVGALVLPTGEVFPVRAWRRVPTVDLTAEPAYRDRLVAFEASGRCRLPRWWESYAALLKMREEAP